MPRRYGSGVQVRLDDPTGTPRQIHVTDDFAIAIEDATYEATAFGMAAKIFDYVRMYSVSAFDLAGYADDDPLIAPPGISGLSQVCPLLIGTGTAPRTLSVLIASGVSVAMDVIIPTRTLNLSHGTEALKRMLNLQPTGPVTVTGNI